MFRLWFCIKDQHDIRLLLLAGLICATACLAAVVILRQQHGESRQVDRRWRIVAGITTGFGIWCTHFVAMLGYDSGIAVGYDIWRTGLSLAVSVGATSIGFGIAPDRRSPADRVAAGGVIVGCGTAAMHYLGMSAVRFPGHFTWDAAFVTLSLLLAIGFAVPSLLLALRRRGLASGLGAAGLLLAAILSLHFFGMTALGILPDASTPASPATLSPGAMAVTIGAIGFAVILIGATAAIANTAAVRAIRSRGRELRILVQGLTDCALYMLDRSGKVISWNAGAQRLTGYSAAEAIGRDFGIFHSEAERADGAPARALAAALANGKLVAEGWRYRKDGSRFWADITIEPVVDDSGALLGFAKITRDSTRAKADQDRQAALAAKLDAALTNMYQGLVLVDGDGRISLVNARYRAMYRIPDDAVLEGLTIAEFMRVALESRAGGPVDEDRIAAGQEWMRACLGQPGGGGTITINYDADSVMDISYRALPDGGFVTTVEDVSERHRSEARIAHMAMHDELTGLPNRTNFNGRLDRAIEAARADATRVAVVAIDLDGFKHINDSHGHAVGDSVLRAIGERLAALPDHIAGRLGGDEFAAARRFADEEELDGFLTRLAGLFEAPIAADGLEIAARASLGVAIFPQDGQDRQQIAGNADLAMYRAKTSRGVHVCRYEYGMDEVARHRRTMAIDLRAAIAAGELSLAYQAQRSVTSGAVTGYEALARWHHPVHGWVPPQDFISVAEESGSIVELGEWVLERACRDAAAWPQPHRVAVNLSPVQLAQPELTTRIADILLDSGLPPSRLELEITETAIIADKTSALHALRRIKALGVTIAIDDFGTGYSSLETLHAFPFDKIKIDRSFILDSDRSEQARAIIRAIIALGSNIGMPVLAEGVESDAQLEMLRSEGCSEAQGYLLGRPAFGIGEVEARAA